MDCIVKPGERLYLWWGYDPLRACCSLSASYAINSNFSM